MTSRIDKRGEDIDAVDRIKTTAFRYGISIGTFLLTMLIAAILRHFSISIDLSILVIGALICSAWFGGRGPGVTAAILFEMVYMILSQPRPEHWAAMLLVEFNRTVLFLVLVLLVTAQKKSMNRLREQEAWLRVTLSSIADGVIATGLNGEVNFMNPTAAAMTGCITPQVAGTPVDKVFQIVNKESTEALETPVLRVIRKGETIEAAGDVILISRDETRRPVDYRAAPIVDDAGKITGAVLIFRDLTERAGLQEQLRQSQKMEAIGRLAGGIAHDFNNLLTVILGYCALASNRSGLVSELREELQEIMQAGERATVLVGQLLAFSRKQVLQPRVLDLNEVIVGTHQMLRRVIGEDIMLSSNTRPGLGHVLADSGQIEQIILNLAVNARDAMPKGGRITIETENVELNELYTRTHSEVEAGRHVMLAVSDTGHGMDAETQRHIFEPFFTTKEIGRGTGLGLSTVYGIVKQSGGHIWLYSEPGKGTTFKVYFPRVDEPIESNKQVPAPVESLHGTETVLLAEDEATVRELTRSILESYGYNVVTAASGPEAILAAQQADSIALLITDVVMPQMSGRELALALASDAPHMRILYLSGYTENAIVHHGVLDEGVAFLPKPFTPEGLARKVREVLDSK
jgi:PAS domain S-box-containing protein